VSDIRNRCLAALLTHARQQHNNTAQELSLLCTREYLECELREGGATPQAPPVGGSSSSCASGCVSAYFTCMRSRAYLSPAEVEEHLVLCQQAGCSPWECGITLSTLPLRYAANRTL
jgi:hypothetical protein